MTLAGVLKKHQSDKTLNGHPTRRSHNYDEVYEPLLEPLKDGLIALLEIGIGSIGSGPSAMGKGVRPGASLRAWKEYFPKGKIYGIDIDPATMFVEHRIETFLGDQLDLKSLQKIANMLGEIDVVIDDGLHTIGAAWNSYLAFIDQTKSYYIIEDIKGSQADVYIKRFYGIKYNWEFYHRTGTKKKDNNLIVIHK